MIEYVISLPAPHTHLVHVEMRVAASGPTLEFAMPAWTPGSYMLREYARHVQDFAAHNSSGFPIAWQKVAKNRWSVDAGAPGPITIRYRVWANDLTVRTSHVDSTHAYLNGASIFLWVAGAEEEAHRVRIDAPEEWRVATSLTEKGEGLFEAASYEELVDSPIEIGGHRSLAWEQRGVPHRWAIWGRASALDEARLIADSRKIVDTCAALFGGLPYDRYLFILHVVPGGRGGLEHRSSTSLQVAPEQTTGKGYERLLALTAHEHFHVWLGKRIRPETLGPFDYERENYSRNLWVIEGFTTYYTDRILLRAGLMTPSRYLERLGDSIARLEALPGRLRQSLEDSSFDAWIRFYRPDSDTPNSQVSYYHKGALVALCLDLEIRRATAGEKSLDDVLRVLWDRYGKEDVGFPEDRLLGIQEIVRKVGGASVASLLERYVTTTDEIDFDRHLAAVGLSLTESSAGDRTAASQADEVPPAHELRLGIRLNDRGSGRLQVGNVLSGLPAYDAGLNADDEILAWNGRALSREELDSLLDSAEEGETLDVLVMRRGSTQTLRMAIGAGAKRRGKLVAEGGDEEADRLREAWLAAPTPD